MIDVNEIKDPYNAVKAIEQQIHRVKTLHSLGKINTSRAKKKLRFLEEQLKLTLQELPETERHYYYYRRLYGRNS